MSTLLLPGMDGTGRLFTEVLEQLASSLNARAVAYPTHEPLSYDALLERIEVPPGPFAIVAESFSGPLGIRLALRHQDRVRALVLVATFVSNPTRVAAQLGALLGPYLFRVKPRAAMVRALLLGESASDEQVDAVRDAVSSVAPPVMSRRLKEIVAVNVEREFAELRGPTLYVTGSRDRLVSRKQMQRMKALQRELEIAEIDAPHLVLQAKPAETAKVLAQFLARFGF